MQGRAVHPPERRADVLRLLQETDLTVQEIGARTGVEPSTIRTWNARAGWLRPPLWRYVVARWPTPRRQAVARLLSQPDNDPADVAAALGFGPDRTALLGAALQLTPLARRKPRRAGRDPAPDIDPGTLRAHLRAHVARQIAAFDAVLSRDGVALAESARLLRDLGGLKRLLDEVGADGPGGAAGEDGDDATQRDLPALRAEIARRYDGFVGGGAAA